MDGTLSNIEYLLSAILDRVFTRHPTAQRCVLPVSFPVDLLLPYIVVNPPERKLEKRTSVHLWAASAASADYISFDFVISHSDILLIK